MKEGKKWKVGEGAKEKKKKFSTGRSAAVDARIRNFGELDLLGDTVRYFRLREIRVATKVTLCTRRYPQAVRPATERRIGWRWGRAA